MLYSPWGPIQYTDIVSPDGVSWVASAGHGGLRINRRIAEQRLTEAARRRAIFEHGYYWFEEDCLYAIAAFELEDLWPAMFRGQTIPPQKHRADLLRIISAYNADYLIERGIEPDPAAFTRWLIRTLADVLREMRRSNPVLAHELAPDIHLTVEIDGGCCQDARPDPRSMSFLSRLGVSFSYQVLDHDLLEEQVS